MSKFSKRDLARGGTIVSTPIGIVQFGIPPETIKDTMLEEEGVPKFFVLPDQLFDFDQGVTTAELEFPAYYHYFFKKQSLTVIATKEQANRIQNVLLQTLFGPKQLHLEQDFRANPKWIPDLRKEMDYFRINPATDKAMEVSDFVHFIHFDEASQKAKLEEGLAITRLGNNRFLLAFGEDTFEIKACLSKVPVTEFIRPQQSVFEPPNFGVTVLGSGHGFAPDAKTSGFLLWIEKQGLLVDPPVHANKWLQKRGIDSPLIDSVLLTHCHADHDSGTLQICLQASKIKLYTTPSIYELFLQKAANLTGLTPQKFLDIVDFCPVFLDHRNYILGAEFVFQYTLHSIPTINFTASYRGKSFAYSADTLNDPEHIEKLYRQGVLDRKRFEQLLDFPWESTLIFHEAGVPPLHTPAQVLAKLPAAVKKRILLVHTAQPPKELGLSLAQPGVENTIRLEVTDTHHQEAMEWLLALSRIEYLKNLSLPKAIEFLSNAKKISFEPGEVLIEKGGKGDYCYFVLEGKASIFEGEVQEKSYGLGVCLGETALLLDIPRTATVKAKTKLTVLALNRDNFLSLIRGTDIPKFLTNLYENRKKQSWLLIDQNPVLSRIEPYQRIQLQGILERFSAENDEVIQTPNSSPKYGYLIETGILGIYKDGEKLEEASKGNFVFGFKEENRKTTLQTLTNIKGFRVSEANLIEFLKRNPGLMLRLNFSDEIQLAKYSN